MRCLIIECLKLEQTVAFQVFNHQSLFLRGGGFLEAVGSAELLGELVHAPGGIDELLLAGEKRMAVRADVDVNLGACATGHKRIAAGAVNGAGLVTGMNLGFHELLLAFPDVRESDNR